MPHKNPGDLQVGETTWEKDFHTVEYEQRIEYERIDENTIAEKKLGRIEGDGEGYFEVERETHPIENYW